MLIDCPKCQQGIEETQTYIMEKAFPRASFGCPHCHVQLKACLNPEFTPWQQNKMQFALLVGMLLLTIFAKTMNIAWLEFCGYFGIILTPLIAAWRDHQQLKARQITLHLVSD